MNKKGFTLVETLAILVILVALSIVVIPGIFTMIKKAKNNSYDMIVETIENSAKLYVNRYWEDIEDDLEFYNHYKVALEELKKEKLIKDNLKDPRIGGKLDYTKEVIITREEDNTLSYCFEDRNCYTPVLLVNELTKEENIVSGTNQGLHYDYLNDSYSFRGSNPKNWMLFNGYLWRIIKVDMNGNVKMIFEGNKTASGTNQNGTISNTVFDNNMVNNFNSNVSIKSKLQNWYDTSLSYTNKTKLKPINWCINNIEYNENGTSKETFLNNECNLKTTDTLPIGLLYGSEYLYASLDQNCISSYKIIGDNGTSCKNNNYLYKSSYNYWGITPDTTNNNVWGVKTTGSLGSPTIANESMNVRPLINLISGTIIDKGNGTFDNPYTIKDIVNGDKEKPIINIVGNNPTIHTLKQPYIDAGATAYDNVDGNITNKLIIRSNINPNVLGTYTVTYIVSDSSGNKSTRIRIVNVVDNVDPKIAFNPTGNSVYAKSRSTTVNVTDDESGVDSNSLKYLWKTNTTEPIASDFTTNFINESTLTTPSGVTGSYYLWILAKDNVDNTTIKRSNAFNLDNTKPVITMNGSNPMTIVYGTVYDDPGATAIDNIDTSISVTSSGTVNVNILGTHTVTYNATDSSGNVATPVVRTINVVDTIAPTVSFSPNGNSTYAKSRSTTVNVTDLESEVNSNSLKYVWTTSSSQPGVAEFTTAFTNKQTITTPSSATGSYYLWIMASDNSNNETITSSNAFNLDNTKPVITLNGDSSVTINKGSIYNDAGATATDNVDTSVTVTLVGTVNPNIEGTYTITYSATDSSGNEAVPVTRTIVVKYVFMCGDTFTDTRDNKPYTTVEIGTQCWFKQDLQYNHNSCLTKAWGSSTGNYIGCRDNESSTYPSYHYQWEVATTACPSGWHLPTDDEWKILEKYLGMTSAQADAEGWRGTDQGTQLKTSAWGGNNSSGFTALPVGYRSTDGSLYFVGSDGYWWSSSPDSSSAWRRLLLSSSSGVSRYLNSQANGYSVRCLLGQ